MSRLGYLHPKMARVVCWEDVRGDGKVWDVCGGLGGAMGVGEVCGVLRTYEGC